MKAVRFQAHGDSSVLRVEEVGDETIRENEVLVEILAAGLNHLDLWIRRGLPGLNIPLPHIPGSDASGIIKDVGVGVEGWSAGDEVVVQPGTFCGRCRACQQGREDMCPDYGIYGETQPGLQRQCIALPVENIGPKPDNLSFAEAAALPLAAFTAWNMLKNRAQLMSGETLLVLGAGSGVGSFAVQMGRFLGARVIAAAGTKEKRDLAYSLGADSVIDQHQVGFSREVKTLTGGHGADVVFEHIGAATWTDSMKSLARGGRLVTCGATTGIEGKINLQHLFYKRQAVLGSTMGSVSDFHEVLHLAAEGDIHPVIDRVFPFKEVQAAHDHLENRHGFGKVVLEGW